jgi:von Willebrand factor type A domain
MRSPTLRLSLAIAALIAIVMTSLAQTKPARPKPKTAPTAETPSEPENQAEPQDIDTLKTDTDLVTVPVIATDQSGLYIPDMGKEEFTILEEGVKQEIAFFGVVSAPFHVVLMLDTSASTENKLKLIQQAAFAFVQQLQTADRVKVVSFDDEVRDLNEFTSDRNILKAAINGTRSGQGTKVYDAMELALNSIRRIQGRKAIVIFTDGVDWHSDHATFASTVRWLDEEGVIVYPIRYDTRALTEQIAREQAGENGPQLPTSDVLGRPAPGGTTPPTFPGGDPIPTMGGKPTTGPFGLPSAQEILRRRRESDPNRDPGRDPSRGPIPSDTSDPSIGRVPSQPTGSPRRTPRPDDSIGAMLDLAYSAADSYLVTIAEKSGGKLLRADTLGSLPDAFAKIAAELRTQYSLGYYPTNKVRDERYRKIRVTTTRKDVVVRARPGYLATNAR